jgi:hypothetical protein
MSSLLIRSISLDILIGEFYVESHLMCFPASLPSDCHHRLELASLVPCRRFRLEVIKGFMPGVWRPRTVLPSADPRDGRCEAKPVTSPYNNPSCTICRLKSFFNFIACTSHDIASHQIDIARHLIGEFYVDSGHLMCFPAALPWDRHRRFELASSVPYRRIRLEVIKGFMPSIWRLRMMLPSADAQDGRCEARPIKPLTSPYSNRSCTTCILKLDSGFRTPSLFLNFIGVSLPSSHRASFVGMVSAISHRGHKVHARRGQPRMKLPSIGDFSSRSQSPCAPRTTEDEAAIRRFLLEVIKGYVRRGRRRHPKIHKIACRCDLWSQTHQPTISTCTCIYMQWGFQS